MMESPDTKVDLRIRFAGLCLFVPDPANKRVHVLMPETGAHAGHRQHDCGDIPKHPLCLYWVSQGEQCSTTLEGKHLVLQGPGWGDPDLMISGVFELKHIEPTSGCPSGDHGKADPITAPTAATMELHAGRSKIINRGARWKISEGGPKQSMPTVLDWRVKNVSYGDLDAVLRGWGVFGTEIPDVGAQNTVNLWILHAPENEQFPGEITSEPKMGEGGSHFGAYYTLLTCGEYDTNPLEPELESDNGDPDRPEWPGPKSFTGMLVNCMLAKADIA